MFYLLTLCGRLQILPLNLEIISFIVAWVIKSQLDVQLEDSRLDLNCLLNKICKPNAYCTHAASINPLQHATFFNIKWAMQIAYNENSVKQLMVSSL